ncbi:imidazole glycerol phosphate synthase, glutamine amidotransferase subunit [Thiovulum sp. ES]|nr:imidazole glycerol phosphate synthase, glutamine amidotransferase subunit [Thiovulum sp. ES]
MKVGIVNYNVGNLASVYNAFQKIGVNATIETDPEKLKNYDKILLPGVGAFGSAIEHLKETGMDKAVLEFSQSGKYMLGICLGMQLLFEESEEFGNHKGLSLINGKVKRFKEMNLKIPHMGWNRVHHTDNKTLFKGLKDPYLYFVHSYYVETKEEFVLGKTEYGIEFTSSVNRENIFGFQPHPEKSHENGLKILRNFSEL